MERYPLSSFSFPHSRRPTSSTSTRSALQPSIPQVSAVGRSKISSNRLRKPITTGWFDLRSDTNALFYLYNIRLNTHAATDLQICNSAYWHENGNKQTHVLGLDRCIDYWVSSSLSRQHHSDFYTSKSYGKRLFADKQFERFNERPLPIELLKYCTGDVALLPDMFDSMIEALQTLPDPELALLNAREVGTWRGLQAMTDEFTQGRHNCLAPWGGISDRGFANFDEEVEGAYSWRERECKVAEREELKRKHFIADWEHRFEKCFETDGHLLQSREVGDDGRVWRFEGYTDTDYELRFMTHRKGYVSIQDNYQER